MGSQESVAVAAGAGSYSPCSISYPFNYPYFSSSSQFPPWPHSHGHISTWSSSPCLVISVKCSHMTNMLAVTIMGLTWTTLVWAHDPSPPDPAPTNTVTDHHKYYTKTVYQNNANKSFDDNFIDMENAEIKSDLSNTMVGALSISPLFSFPFYGHMVSELFITTHGFLSLSPRLHDYIYKTQYIAPLRIKLDPSRSNHSTISVLSLPERLTVEWSNVSVMADAEHPLGGSFTFQVTLRPNGDIVFVYIEVQPVLTRAALYDHEPVAGISDAFLLHGSELHLYSKINIDNVHINTRTVAVFTAQDTCVGQRSCGDCMALRQRSDFSCMWCEDAGHCSDGADRLREDWNQAQCHLTNTTTCDAGHTEYRTSVLSPGQASVQVQTSTVVSAVVSSVCVVILIVLFFVFIYLYGKYNEESTVGRYLKSIQQSYSQFGDKTSKLKSLNALELGKKFSERAKSSAKAKAKPVSEFVNPYPTTNNNNVITAEM